ncbi:hypothetical protein [Celeribacter sp.]|uniref:hypothetical protein n=1 Tax=Celeribacter sp. TaxID=1890673 RepID=UPI003A92715B
MILILFILALVLAWPTGGLSVLAWIGWIAWQLHKGREAHKHSETLTALLEPVFKGEYAEFAAGLELPYHSHITTDDIIKGNSRTEKDLHQIGRLIMKYLANNPCEAYAFINTLKRHGVDESGEMEAPWEVLQWEFYEKRSHGRLKWVGYRAVEALMPHNSLPAFHSVDLAGVSEMVTEMQALWQVDDKRGP